MDEYEKLKELYEHMMAVRKESRQQTFPGRTPIIRLSVFIIWA